MSDKGLLWMLLAITGSALITLILFFLWASSGRYSEDRKAYVINAGSGSASSPADELTVVSYNIGYLSGLTNNQAVSRTQQLYDTHLETAIAALKAVEPDIVALQEVDIQSQRSFEVDQVTALSQALTYSQRAVAINWDKRYVPFPFWPPAAHFGSMLSGQAVLSRLPIVRHKRLVLDQVATNPFYYNALYLDRLAQVAEVAVGDRRLIVINVHLEAFDGTTREKQTVFIRQMAERYAQDYPVLVLGDFNSALNREQEGDLKTIKTMMASSMLVPATPPEQFDHAAAWTFPADTPQYKLDYIFYTPATIEMLAVKVLTAAQQASDHLPLMMQLRFL